MDIVKKDNYLLKKSCSFDLVQLKNVETMFEKDINAINKMVRDKICKENKAKCLLTRNKKTQTRLTKKIENNQHKSDTNKMIKLKNLQIKAKELVPSYQSLIKFMWNFFFSYLIHYVI
jgi:hypothetical protein